MRNKTDGTQPKALIAAGFFLAVLAFIPFLMVVLKSLWNIFQYLFRSRSFSGPIVKPDVDQARPTQVLEVARAVLAEDSGGDGDHVIDGKTVRHI